MAELLHFFSSRSIPFHYISNGVCCLHTDELQNSPCIYLIKPAPLQRWNGLPPPPPPGRNLNIRVVGQVREDFAGTFFVVNMIMHELAEFPRCQRNSLLFYWNFRFIHTKFCTLKNLIKPSYLYKTFVAISFNVINQIIHTLCMRVMNSSLKWTVAANFECGGKISRAWTLLEKSV